MSLLSTLFKPGPQAAPSPSLLRSPLQPAWVVGRAYERLLREIPVDDTWVHAVQRAAERGAVVHLVRNVSLLDLLALDHLTRRLGLPRIGFANELGGWLGPEALRGSGPELLRATVQAGRAALLFMKRPPTVLARAGAAHRGRSEGDDLLRVLIEHHRATGAEIMLVPEILVWTSGPERFGFSVVDTLFGSADFPGELRAAGQLLLNHRHAVIRAGEPVSLREFLAQEGAAGGEAAARRLGYALLRKVERERRAVLGPARKPPDRIREEVLKSPKLQAVIRDLCGPDEKARALLDDKARGMLRELMTTPDPGILRGLETIAETLAEQVYAGIDVDREGIERVREAARRGSIVLLPSHKSHVDYLLLSLVLRRNGLMVPVIAAGDNLAFFPVGPVFRRAGAFFIRRSFRGDRLYAAVVDAYIRRLMRDGFAIEFFLEGGRSRTGKLLSPKVGLLNMVVEAALSAEGRTVSFVPVSIGYERMMEEGAYARELSGEAKRKESAAALLKVGAVLREKYGRANVQFGQVLELGELHAGVAGVADGRAEGPLPPARRRALVSRLAHRVMSEINRVTAVTPGSLVALSLLCHGRRGISHLELCDHCARLVRLVTRLGARTTPSLTRPGGELREAAVREAAQLFVRGGLVHPHVPGDTLTGAARRRARIYTGDDVIYTVPDDQRLMLDISKNIIVHLFVDRALVSVALLSPPGPPAPRAAVRERVRSLSRLFKLEFMFRADAPFERIFDDTTGDMAAQGEIVAEGEALGFGPGHDGLDGRGWVTFYAAVVRSFLEAYRVAARAARVLARGPLTEKELAERALRVGERMFLGGEIERSEAVCQPTLENAFAAFVDQGYLKRLEGKLALAESFASEEAAETIETRVASYLSRRAGDSAW
jgi:glycerol-3-phosphate O-acyltransferase